MSFNRRSFLKSIIATSMTPFFNFSFAKEIAAYSGHESYLLLQGLFFMEFHEKNLIVATPHHPHHVFYKRAHRQNDLISMPINPTYTDLRQGTFCCFPPEIIRFSYRTINQTKGFLRKAHNYRCKMILPCPKEIFTLRRGSPSSFLPDPSTNVGGSLDPVSQIATVVCLAYDPVHNARPWIESYYAEHLSSPSTGEVNSALESAKELCGKDFDLKLKCRPITPPPVPVDRDEDLPGDLDYTDEFSFGEFIGLSTAQIDKPKGQIAPSVCPDLSPKPTTNSDTQKDGVSSCPILAGDVSSCPIFGIHG